MKPEHKDMTPAPKKRRCEEVNHLNVADMAALDRDVHAPKFRPGKDHELLEGYHNRSAIGATLNGMEFLSSNGSVHRIRVRYKPKEVVAYFVQSEHLDESDRSRKSRSGWLVPGPGKGVFYVPEDEFLRFFEFVEDEGRIIA